MVSNVSLKVVNRATFGENYFLNIHNKFNFDEKIMLKLNESNEI